MKTMIKRKKSGYVGREGEMGGEEKERGGWRRRCRGANKREGRSKDKIERQKRLLKNN